MRILIIIISAFILIQKAKAQNLVNDNRKFINPINLSSSKDGKDVVSVKKNYKFTIVGEKDDKYKIYFWNWSETAKNYDIFNVDSETNEQKFFLIDKDLIDIYSVKIFSKFDPTYGVLTFPFKWRLNTGDVEPTFSLNIAGGVKWRPDNTNRHVFSFLLGAGPSSAKLNAHNTNTEEAINEVDVAAVTLSSSLLYQFEFVQFGVSVGFDKIFNNDKYDWSNQGKPWFTLGIGLNIFTDKQSSQPKEVSNDKI